MEDIKKKAAEEKPAALAKEDWLILKLQEPVEYQTMEISTLDLTGIRDMTGSDLNIVYDLYASLGGDGYIMQESTLLFAQVIASRATGYPVEAIMALKAKDSILLKNRVYRFFFLSV